MNKGNSKQLSIFFFSIFLFGKIFSSSEEILNKYSSIKTPYNSIFMNISEFKYDEYIYLTLNSEYKCDDYLEYLFLDDIEDTKDKLEFKYISRPRYRLENYRFGKTKYTSLFYIIAKRSDIIFNLRGNIKGNLLYLEFNCKGEVEIINTKQGYEHASFFFLFYFSATMLFIFIYIIIKSIISSCIIVRKKLYKIPKSWEVKNNIDKINSSPSYLNQNQTNVNYPKEKIIYVEVSENLFNMKEDNAHKNISENKCKNDGFQSFNRNGIYTPNYNCYNMQRVYQEYPRIQNLGCPQAPYILNSEIKI